MTLRNIIFLSLLATLFSCGDRDTDASKITPKDKDASLLFTLTNPNDTQLRFVNDVEETMEENYLNYEFMYNGSGVAVGDINNDGLADIYFAGNSVSDKLYLNEGELRFRDISTPSGIVQYDGWSTGVTMIDINADGWLDIYVCRSGPSKDLKKLTNRLFINNKDNTFTEAAQEYGLQRTEHSIQSAFFDYDLDGDLDMYLLNHPPAKFKSKSVQEHMRDMKSGKIQTDIFFENQNGTFVDVSKKSNLVNFGYRHGIAVGDLNKDGYPDLYISSDFDEPDVLEINQGDGTFKNETEKYLNHISFNSMGNEMTDINNDGLLDLFVVDMASDDHYRSKAYMASMDVTRFKALTDNGYQHQYMFNTLQLNNGGGSFSEVAQLSGIAKTDWSWAPLFFDMDHDGLKDLFITNGIKENFLYRDLQKEVEEQQAQKQQKGVVLEDLLNIVPSDVSENLFFQNKDGLKFEKMSGKWAAPSLYNSNGVATADFDNDGDLDFVTNNMGSNASLYISNAANGTGGNYLKLKLQGPSKNPQAIGAKIEVVTAAQKQWHELYSTRGYLSSVDFPMVFGLADEQSATVFITWPDGTRTTHDNLSANTSHTINYEKGAIVTNNISKTLLTKQPIKNKGIAFTHKEDDFNDYEVQILLPHSQSSVGPCTAQADINKDGYEDLFIGGAAGQSGILYLGSKDGTYIKQNGPWTSDSAQEDTGAILFDSDADGDLDLYIVSGGAHQEEGHPDYKDRLYINEGGGAFAKANKNTLPETIVSGQAVTAADIDNDGDQDLFIGGRIIPDKYPYAPKSYILRNANGIFSAEEIAVNNLVTKALFTDYDGDGDMDLMTAGEWSKIQIFNNDDGSFTKASIPSLDKTTGLWFGLAQQDIDGDGDMDYFAGNLGLNAKFKTTGGKVFHIYSDDFDSNGTTDVVLSSNYKGKLVPSRGRECSSQQMPFITDKFVDYKSFASATLEDIYGEKLNTALHYQADRLDSVYLENNGDGTFTITSLPMEMQLSPLTSFAFTDITGDGKNEVLLVGNLYNVEVETERYDAFKGGVLTYKNNKLTTLPYNQTGFKTEGDSRTVQILNQGGEKQIIVTTNNGAPLLFEKSI
ncbi:RNA-binding protein [Dokdonia sinensis]|uniref:RNA-binding protein n=1 Tax=Dokdonia sinensis TaxID=2479847 RepID=A0A3M0GFP6_9FLAO|nr:VCBS repeat-containing protein [Dokdonia sinensis]RMB63921.1 RNA-binding protein [Dokdonia sinensis]